MRKLSKIIMAGLIAGTAAGVALPAQAQPYPDQRHDRYERDDRYDRDGRYERDDRYDRDGRYDRHDNRWDDRFDHHDRRDYRGQAQAIRAQIDQLQQRIERNDGRDRISEREAAALRRDVYRLRLQFRDYNRNGLSQREAQVLQSRIHDIRQRLRYERRDRDGRRW
jgi:predicted RNase H-like nuclease (RuvC/YqgF family)